MSSRAERQWMCLRGCFQKMSIGPKRMRKEDALTIVEALSKALRT
jgi:hypothetical protein